MRARRTGLGFAALAAAALAAGCVSFAPKVEPLAPDALEAKYASEASNFLTTGSGLRVHYRDEGCADCPPLVLVHGAWASLHAWEPLVDRLGDRHRLVSFDLPAHGLTGPPPEDAHGPEAGVALLDEVAEQLSLGRFALAGNSLGGHVAWRYALARSERVDALVLIDAAGSPKPLSRSIERGKFFLMFPFVWRAVAGTPSRDTVAWGADMTYHRKEVITPAHLDRTWELMRYPGTSRAFAKGFARWPIHDRKAKALAGLAVPTLVVWGREDRLIPLASGQWFAKTIPGAELVILEGVGHAPMEEAPDETAAAVAAFLARPAGAQAAEGAAVGG